MKHVFDFNSITEQQKNWEKKTKRIKMMNSLFSR